MELSQEYKEATELLKELMEVACKLTKLKIELCKHIDKIKDEDEQAMMVVRIDKLTAEYAELSQQGND